ncbi:MAG TPA: hypothetical protein PKD00_00490 [Burkholderiales bacterium]|nr:hypothetical protein [Burkholderiales bacterium]
MAIIAISGKISSERDTVGKIIQYLTGKQPYKISIEEFIEGNHWLINYLNANWEIKKFEKKLKEIVSILTGISVEDLEKQEVKDRVLGEEWWYFYTEVGGKKMYPYLEYKDKPEYTTFLKKFTVRQLLQEVGTEAMRNVLHPNIWVNALFADYNTTGFDYEGCENKEIKGSWKYPNWIISDMRFSNELEAVKDRGGITIRINRPQQCKECKIDLIEVSDKILTCPRCKEAFKQHVSETVLDDATFDYTIENNAGIPELIEKVKQILKQEKII